MGEQGKKVMDGLCQCGCGEKSGVYGRTHPERGTFQGEPRRFIDGHNLGKMSENPRWKGGRKLTGSRYVELLIPEHESANGDGYVLEHIVIAEKALGRKLKGEEHCHHADSDRTNNRHGNLGVCPDLKYHHLLHIRTRALAACGNANFRKCPICKEHDDVENMRKRKGVNQYLHPSCWTELQRKYAAKKKKRIAEQGIKVAGCG